MMQRFLPYLLWLLGTSYRRKVEQTALDAATDLAWHFDRHRCAQIALDHWDRHLNKLSPAVEEFFAGLDVDVEKLWPDRERRHAAAEEEPLCGCSPAAETDSAPPVVTPPPNGLLLDAQLLDTYADALANCGPSASPLIVQNVVAVMRRAAHAMRTAQPVVYNWGPSVAADDAVYCALNLLHELAQGTWSARHRGWYCINRCRRALHVPVLEPVDAPSEEYLRLPLEVRARFCGEEG